eukprot:SAG11_NODE_5566_length_1522_cov_0.943781_1_plen_124_part_00
MRRERERGGCGPAASSSTSTAVLAIVGRRNGRPRAYILRRICGHHQRVPALSVVLAGGDWARGVGWGEPAAGEGRPDMGRVLEARIALSSIHVVPGIDTTGYHLARSSPQNTAVHVVFFIGSY